MATNGSRDVKLSLSIETLGEEGIKDLRDALAQLSKQGGDAAPEFQRLANEIDRLGDQAGALRSFQSLAETVRELGQTQAVAADKAAEFKAKLDAASASVQKAASEQAALKTRFQEANAALEQTKGELTILRNSYDENGKRVANYKARIQELTGKKVEQSAVVTKLRDEMRESNAAVREAEAAEKKAQTAYNGSDKALQSLNKTLEARRAELAQQQKAVSDMGLATDDLAQSQASLIAAINGTGAAAQRLKTELDAARAAEKALADQNARAVADNAERIRAINDEIKYRQQLAAQREAAARQAASAEATAASEAVAAQRRTQAEEQAAFNANIARLNAEIKYRQQLAAQREAAARDAIRREVEVEKQGAKEREAAAKEAADAIANAFKTTGAKSAADLRNQITAVKQSMDLLGTQAGLTGGELKAAMQAGAQRVKELERELRGATNALTLADKAADLFSNSMGQIAAGNLIADGIGSLINQIKDMGRQFLEANLEMERLTRTMTVITGSADGAAQKIKFLRDTANLAGVAVGAITDSFIRFNASAQTAGIASEQVDAIFRAVTVSGSKMGMSADRVALALDALGQIASKGTVSMEELRQQLGDSLPGALAISAKGLGLTTGELVKMVETGQLAASEFFPAFKRGLEDSFGSAEKNVEGLFQAWNRLRNAFRELYQEASDSAAFKALASSLDFLASNLRTVVDVAYGLGKALLALKVIEYVKGFLDLGNAARASAAGIATKTTAVVADTAATALNTTATTANTAAKVSNAAATGTMATGITALTAAKGVATTAAGVLTLAWSGLGAAARGLLSVIGGLPGLLVAVALNAKELGTAIGEQAAKWMGWGKVMDEAQAKLKAQEEAEKRAAEERTARTARLQQELDEEVRSLTDKAKSLESATQASEKHTKSVQAQGDYELRLAGLLADSTAKMQAELVAANNLAEASEKERAKKAEYLSVLEQELQKRQAVIASGREITTKYREQTEALKDKIDKAKEEVAQSASAVDNARLEVAQRRINIETLKDNSARVGEFAAEMEKAAERVRYLTEMQKAGLDVDNLLKVAKVELATATRLYGDSVADATRKIELKNQASKAENDTILAGLQAQKADLESRAKSAEAAGRGAEATRLLVQAKQIEIQIIQATVKAITDEVNGRIALLRAQRDAIKGNDDVAESRRKELDIQIKQEQARLVEAQSRLANVRNIQDEIRALQGAAAARESETDALARNNAERERAISAREKEMELAEREAALERRRKNVDKDGFTLDNNGNRMTQNVITPESAFNDAKSMGLDDRTALEISRYYENMAGNDPRKMDISGFNKLVNDRKLEDARRRTGAGGVRRNTQVANSTLSTGGAAGTGGAAKTYNVQIGGTTIKTVSDADAQALISVLKKASLTQ